MIYVHQQSFTNVYLLNIQLQVAAKRVVMVDASVFDQRQNVQRFVSVVTTAAAVVRRDFIVFLVKISSNNQELCSWNMVSRYFCSLHKKNSSQSDYFYSLKDGQLVEWHEERMEQVHCISFLTGRNSHQEEFYKNSYSAENCSAMQLYYSSGKNF